MIFGSSPSLERIGVSCFEYSGLEEVNIPDGVRELCDQCFLGCEGLRRVAFSSSSSLERIGVSCFASSVLEEVNIPDGVRELCDRCFYRCTRLRRVTFNSSSSLERIGVKAFGAVNVRKMMGLRSLFNSVFNTLSNLLTVSHRVLLLQSVYQTMSVSCVISASKSAKLFAV